MEAEGKVQKNVGKAQAGFGNLKEDVKKPVAVRAGVRPESLR
jgi:uncharacterized protein YjbJ (UPF0337 family)